MTGVLLSVFSFERHNFVCLLSDEKVHFHYISLGSFLISANLTFSFSDYKFNFCLSICIATTN